MQTVKVDAARSNRSLTGGQPDGAASLRQRRITLANPVLLGWARMINLAVADAKKTRHGLPTGGAIAARWWISDYRPSSTDRTKLGRVLYSGSFESCCELLGRDVDEERKRLLAEIDDSLVQQIVRHAGDQAYEMRARVLACSGVPTAVGRQYILGLVHPDDYHEVADAADQQALSRAKRREAQAASRARRTRRLRLA